jgi:menaquinone-specific isochorismate synthase
MLTLPLDPRANASPAALGEFLASCREAARSDGREQIVSISLAVEALDPLAVLESIYEPGHPHFYAERPAAGTALAGAEVAATFTATGPERFAALQAWADDVFDRTIAVGDVEAPFGGPHVLVAATFFDTTEPGEAFPALTALVPRWQVARAGGVTTAVANVPVAPDADLAALAERVWRAHAKFGRFSYHVGENRIQSNGAGATVGGECGTSEAGDYRAAVAGALGRIEAGEFEKIVLARAVELRAATPFHPLTVLNGLRQRFPDCFAFSVANGAGDSFIGASPERLLRVSRGVLETEALAGTARRGQSAAEDAAAGAALLVSEKDRREQGVVLESIKRRLAPLGLVAEHPAEPTLLKLANVQHLYTPVRAVLPEGRRLLEALRALFPTPAVGGSPRAAAMGRIRELEGFPRGLYGGTVGWLNARGGGEFLVGIRSGLVRGERAVVYAGAGIVAGSTPEQEFAETELKFRALRDAFVHPAAP